MLARHRQSLILQAVRSDGSARVSDLTARLGVSDMTIRRDLEILARDGLVEKVHGGAVLPGSGSGPGAVADPGFEARLELELPEKSAIARAAAGLVQPGSAIAIGGGTTTFALAQCLLDVPGLTIVTNSLRVSNLFAGAAYAEQVVLTGGVRTPSDTLTGPVADLMIRSMHFDLVFLGCYGFDAEAGLTTPSLAEAETNRTFARVARKVVILADHTKCGLIGLSSFARLSEVDVLVTDGMLPREARAEIALQVGEIRYADLVAPVRPDRTA